jgi:hypothetical protein
MTTDKKRTTRVKNAKSKQETQQINPPPFLIHPSSPPALAPTFSNFVFNGACVGTAEGGGGECCLEALILGLVVTGTWVG